MNESLPYGISVNSVENDGVPIGALVTLPGVARKCVRCGHYECPCCNDWCDDCLRDLEDSGQNAVRDGDWIIAMVNGEEVHRWHVVCAENMQCKYEDPAAHPLMRSLFEAHESMFANVGGGFGVTDDGRVWMAGKTQEQVWKEYENDVKSKFKQTRERASETNQLESLFVSLGVSERSYYLAGMSHALELMSWIVQDAGVHGKRTSAREGSKMVAAIQSVIDRFRGLA